MTDEKKPRKREPLFVPAGSPQAIAKREQVAERNAAVLDRADEILDRYIGGETLQSIGDSLNPPWVAWRLRDLLATSEKTADAYKSAATHRAHALVEDAVHLARTAASLGDAAGYRVATDTFLKVAGKLSPGDYGDKNKVELTGKDGTPLKLLSMTDEQLMAIAAKAYADACKEAGE